MHAHPPNRMFYTYPSSDSIARPPCRLQWPSLRDSFAFVVGHAQKIVQFLLGLLTAVAVSFLQFSDELFDVALDLVDIVIGHFSPPVSDVSLHLKPFAF